MSGSPQASATFAERFAQEIECWCYGLAAVRSKVTPKHVHAVVRELEPLLAAAVRARYRFNVPLVAEELCSAAGDAVPAHEVAMHILARLPEPSSLNSSERSLVAELSRDVERQYESHAKGALASMLTLFLKTTESQE